MLWRYVWPHRRSHRLYQNSQCGMFHKQTRRAFITPGEPPVLLNNFFLVFRLCVTEYKGGLATCPYTRQSALADIIYRVCPKPAQRNPRHAIGLNKDWSPRWDFVVRSPRRYQHERRAEEHEGREKKRSPETDVVLKFCSGDGWERADINAPVEQIVDPWDGDVGIDNDAFARWHRLDKHACLAILVRDEWGYVWFNASSADCNDYRTHNPSGNTSSMWQGGGEGC